MSTAAGAAGEARPKVEVRRSARRRRTVTAYRERDTIVVLVPQRLSRAEESRFVDDLVAKVLAREARAAPPRGDLELRQRAERLAAAHLRDPDGRWPQARDVIWVDNQRQRWGSCTPGTGAIRLSRRLQAMPSWVVDYVLVHELAHLRHLRHDTAFWALVSRFPEAERARGFLEGWDAAQRGPASAPADPAGPDDVVD